MEFCHQIAQVERGRTQKLFYGTRFFSVMMDEATDTSRLEQCILFVRFSAYGKIYTKFVGIDSVIRADATQLTAVILGMLKKKIGWTPPEEVLGDLDEVDHEAVEESGEVENV